MASPLEHVSYTCFGLSYLLAFGLEAARLRWVQPAFRYAGLTFGALGLFTHSVFLAVHHPTPATPYGSLLAVAWVLSVFYLYGTLHRGNQAWAVFVLPVVLGLVALSYLLVSSPGREPAFEVPTWLTGGSFWGAAHGLLLLLAAVGVCVGFLASVMYLVQARRLRTKASPLGGVKMLSLERLEAMNRRAVNVAFPLLTVGLLLGAVLLRQYHDLADHWFSVKVLGTVGLWAVCVLLFYLRCATNVPGRRLAVLTVVAFALMVVVLAAAHPFASNIEIRNPKSETSSNTESRGMKSPRPIRSFGFRYSNLFRISRPFRISDFGFRSSGGVR